MNRKTSTLLSIGISAALVAAAIWFLFNHHNSMWRAVSWSGAHGPMMAGGMGILMILFWGVVLLALVLLISAAMSGRRSVDDEDLLEIIKRRYARGEIDKRRFEAMRSALQQSEADHEP